MPGRKAAPKAKPKAKPKTAPKKAASRPKAAARPKATAKAPAAPPAPPSPRAAPKLVLEESAPQLEARGPPVPSEAVQAVSPEDLVAGLPPPEPGRVPKRFILLDSNALMMQFQFSVDIENELRRIIDVQYEIVVPDIVLGELRNLAGTLQGKDRGEAVMAIRLAQTFRMVKTEGPADTGILRLAEKLQAIVVTNDKILRARLRAKNIPNIHLRSKAFLTVEGHIGF